MSPTYSRSSCQRSGRTCFASIESVHARKTGALIACAISGGARLAGAAKERVEALEKFGFEIGVAFQIADDVLDADEDDDE